MGGRLELRAGRERGDSRRQEAGRTGSVVGRGAGAGRGRRDERGEAVTRSRIAFVSILLAALSIAPAARGVANLDELLEQTRNAHEKEKRESAAREQQFQASR